VSLVVILTPLIDTLAKGFEIPSKPETASAIVVLGAGLNGEGLSSESMRRAVHAIAFYKKRLAPLIVFSGPGRNSITTEGPVRARLARDLGIPPEAIVIVEEAETTQQESLRIAALLAKQGEKKIYSLRTPCISVVHVTFSKRPAVR
jgi:uncharacterized SAM-binding protein YcdF (DUF218 family)